MDHPDCCLLVEVDKRGNDKKAAVDLRVKLYFKAPVVSYNFLEKNWPLFPKSIMISVPL